MMTMQPDDPIYDQDEVRALTDHALLTRIHQSALESKRRLVEEIVMLGEIQRRGLHLAMAYSTMYEFCYRELRFSEDQAYRYMLAVRFVDQFPEVLDDLESGRLHLASLSLLKKHVWLKEHRWLLDLARGKSKRELEKALAKHFPKHDAPSSRIQPLSETRSRLEVTLSAATIEKIEYAKQLMSHSNPAQHVEVVIDKALDVLIAKLEKSRLAKVDRPRAKALRADAARTEALHAEAPRAETPRTEALRTETPRTDAARTETPRTEAPRTETPRTDAARTDAPRTDAARTDAPRTETAHAEMPRTKALRAEGPRIEDVSRRTRREVFERDGWQCSFVSESGDRCESQVFLELDHKIPRALHGPTTADNLRVVCRNHNGYEARRLLGEEKITRAIAWAKSKVKAQDQNPARAG